MCGCVGDTPCGYHAGQIMTGLAEARDLNDQGHTAGAERVMARLRDNHGAARVRLAMDEIRDGKLDLSVYGNPYLGRR
ncbi:hypothetical protein ACIBCR_15310 [Micromonospora echinospora]|uniref:hypothetical protein n=1 Tax=Micromonospora echinospora TaxID=1877 RepID=UPI0037BBF399